MIDAHLHVVDAATAGPDRTGHPDGAWWESLDASPASVAARVDAAGVAGGVLVQAVGAHGFDNTFVIESAAALGDRWANWLYLRYIPAAAEVAAARPSQPDRAG